ncbi:hypothetical protein J3R30DRAFT_3403413 [Lentinula aciculospora]|uniref:Uncharacterized protein n=1 Tax=Lentinula aciculospora TaxID=153920 RepID=A0A9W9AEU6_9AGAR|nr:hypothetical protein J3R30DRAFT_3403413 [Lentinula aciculospora]
MPFKPVAFLLAMPSAESPEDRFAFYDNLVSGGVIWKRRECDPAQAALICAAIWRQFIENRFRAERLCGYLMNRAFDALRMSRSRILFDALNEYMVEVDMIKIVEAKIKPRIFLVPTVTFPGWGANDPLLRLSEAYTYIM